MTKGVKNALSRGRVHSLCNDCGFPLPRYPGRYPKACPSCGEERPTETPHESIDPAMDLLFEDGVLTGLRAQPNETISLIPDETPEVGTTLTFHGRTVTVVEVSEGEAFWEYEDGEEFTFKQPLR